MSQLNSEKGDTPGNWCINKSKFVCTFWNANRKHFHKSWKHDRCLVFFIWTILLISYCDNNTLPQNPTCMFILEDNNTNLFKAAKCKNVYLCSLTNNIEQTGEWITEEEKHLVKINLSDISMSKKNGLANLLIYYF